MLAALIQEAKDFLGRRDASASSGGVVVLGDLAVDRFIFGRVERISPEAPVPVLNVESVSDRLGCAANVAANLAALAGPLAGPVEIFGVAGRDAGGELLDSLLRGLGDRVRVRIERDEKRPTTLKTRYLASHHHQLLRVDEESTRPLATETAARLESALAAALRSARVLVVQDYAKGVLRPDWVARLYREAREAGVRVVVDPTPRSPAELYRGADLITPNLEEAEALAGRRIKDRASDAEVEALARELKERLGLREIILTRSARGLTYIPEGGPALHLPTLARAVYDVTGAGDTVVSLLAAALAAGLRVPVACVLATAAAAVVVAKVGTATASNDEIFAALEEWSA